MENNDTSKTKVVHTFSDDMVGALGENQSGSLRSLIEAEEAREKEREALSPNTPENKMFIIISTLLLIFSFAGLVYVVWQRGDEVTTRESQVRSLIFVDRTQFLPIDNQNTEKSISTLRSAMALSTVKQGGIEAYYLTRAKKVLGLDTFAAITLGSAPKDILDLTDNFLIGSARLSKNEPFILLRVRSFQDVFPEMILWEDKLFYDVHDLFGMPLGKENNYLLNKKFEDGFVQNKNARILYRDNGIPALMYIYADDTSVIITSSEQAASEVMRRLSTGNIRK
ncbi:MAG: hypothetical protein ACKOW9_04720 [Candidatus Paceibacterota bacterium]